MLTVLIAESLKILEPSETAHVCTGMALDIYLSLTLHLPYFYIVQLALLQVEIRSTDCRNVLVQTLWISYKTNQPLSDKPISTNSALINTL